MTRLMIVGLFALIAAIPAEDQRKRIKGSELITPDINSKESMIKLIPIETTQKEIDLFLVDIDKFTAWMKEHAEEVRVLEKKSPNEDLSELLKLSVWKRLGLSGPEFLAVGTKLSMARQIKNGELDAAFMKKHADGLEESEKHISGPEEAKREMAKEIAFFRALANAIEHCPKGNIELYEQNKEALDKAMQGLEDAIKPSDAAKEEGREPPPPPKKEDENPPTEKK